jgi:hypothetical protein
VENSRNDRGRDHHPWSGQEQDDPERAPQVRDVRLDGGLEDQPRQQDGKDQVRCDRCIKLRDDGGQDQPSQYEGNRVRNSCSASEEGNRGRTQDEHDEQFGCQQGRQRWLRSPPPVSRASDGDR